MSTTVTTVDWFNTENNSEELFPLDYYNLSQFGQNVVVIEPSFTFICKLLLCKGTFLILEWPCCLWALEHLVLQISSKRRISLVMVGLCSLRIGVAFTGISGDTMEIQTLGKTERFVKPHWLGSFQTPTCKAAFFFLLKGQTAKVLTWL